MTGVLQPIFGKNRVLYFRKLGDAEAGAKLAMQTEHTWSYERSIDSTQTKDGAVSSDGGLETTLEINALSSNDEVNRLLKDSVVEGFKLEVWDVDLTQPESENQFPATYAQGLLDSWEIPAPNDGPVEISTSMIVDAKPVEGKVTVTKEDQAAIQYAFKDLIAEAGGAG